MTMSEPNRIDIVAEDEQRGKVLLVMTEHRPWEAGPMHDQFRAKLQAYLNYVLGGRFAQDHPGKGPRDVVIQVGCREAPGAATLALFEKARRDLRQHGIEFEYEVLVRSGGPRPPVAPAPATGQAPAAPAPRRPWWRFWG